jgi:UDPglucose 6-dehydrogenase
MKITVFGTGYVGLVTGACFADSGHEVTCVDIDANKIEALKAGVVPIFEPGLSTLVQKNFAAGRLHFTCDAAPAVAWGEVIFVAVGTPPRADGSADLGHVMDVARIVATHMTGYKIVVDKSTVPVGTADRVAAEMAGVLRQRGADIEFDVCSNPEFLKEGSAVEDFMKAPRIVIGADSDRARAIMRECYSPYSRKFDKLMFMDARSAELTKYAANVMLATKISLINEIANLAERLGADVEHVRLGIGADPRIGYHFIYPGCGYGGSCFPKDVRALSHSAAEVGFDARLIRAVEATNTAQKAVLFEKLDQIFDGDLAGRTIALWGLAFKPETDDMREAPSRTLMEALWARGARVRAFDPEAMKSARALYGDRDDLVLVSRQEDAAEGADALAICTEWKQFRIVDFDRLKKQLRQPIIVDGRNLYEPSTVRRHGLLYYAIGRGDSTSLHRTVQPTPAASGPGLDMAAIDR